MYCVDVCLDYYRIDEENEDDLIIIVAIHFTSMSMHFRYILVYLHIA